jgi:Family of unknown function (DUF5764)
MDSTGENIGVYSEAKGEYTRQLCQFIVPALMTYFLEIIEDVKQKDTDYRKLLWNFQNHLKDIPEWNVDKVKRETGRIQSLVKCDYLEELLTAVFIAHTKVLSAIRLTTKQKKLQISIPKLEHFLHRTLSDCARLVWSNVYLFTPTGAAVERQKNLNTVEGLLNEGILQSIRTMLPVKSILREYLHEDGDDLDDEAKPSENVEEESKPVVTEEVKPVVTEEESKPVVTEEVKPVVTEEESKPLEAKVEEVKVEEAKPEEAKPEEAKPEEAKPVVVEEVAPPAQTIVIDTEPSVRFTNIDTVFQPTGESDDVASIEEVNMDDTLQFMDTAPTALDGALDYEEM